MRATPDGRPLMGCCDHEAEMQAVIEDGRCRHQPTLDRLREAYALLCSLDYNEQRQGREIVALIIASGEEDEP